jgi:hypothetical protein
MVLHFEVTLLTSVCKLESWKYKKYQNPEILTLLSGLQNFTCKSPHRPREVPPLLPPRSSHTDPHSYTPKKSRYFTWPIKVVKSRISQMPLQTSAATDGKSRDNLLALSECLKVKFLQMRKSAQILRFSRFWHFFRICKIQILGTPTGHVKSTFFFSIQGVIFIRQQIVFTCKIS